MAKKNDKSAVKKGAKLGEIKGKRRPFMGAVLIFLGIIFGVAIFDFDISQEIFYRDGILADFVDSTRTTGPNLCGKLGATFCVLGSYAMGRASILIPVYLFWTGLMCFKRKQRPVDFADGFAMFLSILSFSALAALAQQAVGGAEATSYYLAGWGGKLGGFIYGDLLYPAMDKLGSGILLIAVSLFCQIVIFVENPSVAAAELSDSMKRAPQVLPGFFARLWYALAFLPKLLIEGLWALFFGFKKRREPVTVDVPSEDLLLSPSGSEKVIIEEEPPTEEPSLKRGGLVGALGTLFKRKAQDEPAGILDAVNVSEVYEEPPAEEPPFFEEPPADEINIQRFYEEEPSSLPPEDPFFGETPQAEYAPEPVLPEAFEEAPQEPDAFEEPAPKRAPRAPRAARKPELEIVRTEVEKVSDPEDSRPKKKGDYIFPPMSLLAEPEVLQHTEDEDYEARMREIIATFDTFKIKVTSATVSPGPVVTMYEVYPAPGVKLSRISSLENDIALGLKAQKVRIIAPLPGRGTVGVEVPNRNRENVYMRDIFQSKAWRETKADIPVVLGKDVTGKPKILDLAKMPHALIAGSTGSGKSVCVNGIITSLLYRFTPEDLRFIMIDPKVVELQIYNSLPHMLIPVVTDPRKVPAALKWLIAEMSHRYEIFAAAKVKNIAGFNAKILKDIEEQAKAEALAAEMTPEERAAAMQAESSAEANQTEIPDKKLPYIICIIDELSDLMLVAGKEVELSIMRLTALARAAGIHLLVATQRPSADVVTGIIKANLPTRIAFKVASLVDSRTILDAKGAEALIGKGDMLFTPPGDSDLVRAQGAFLSDAETAAIVEFLKINGEPEFEEEIQNQMDASLDDGAGASEDGEDLSGDGSYEDLVSKSMEVIRRTKRASTSNLQRRLSIGYNKAARIMDTLEDRGYVGPDNGPGKPREIHFD